MKRFLILFLLIFIVPFWVKAEETNIDIENVVLSTNKRSNSNFNVSYTCRDASCHYNYGTSYEYVNGEYHLTGTTKIDNYDSLKRYYHWSGDIFYTCRTEETSCDVMYAVFVNNLTIINQNATTLKMENGQDVEDVRYIKIASDYEKVNGKYKLINPESFDLSTILRNRSALEGKYYCYMDETECDTLSYFFMASAGAHDYTTTEYEYVYASDYYYEDGVFKLKDIADLKWPKYEEKKGYYTCLSKGTSCKKIYKAGNYIPSEYSFSYEFLEMSDDDQWSFQKISYVEKSISGSVGGDILGVSYIPEGSTIEIEDSSILKIEDGKIMFLKPGITRIIAKTEDSYIVLSVTVTGDDIENPKTGTGILLIIILVLTIMMFSVFMVLGKKIKSYVA